MYDDEKSTSRVLVSVISTSLVLMKTDKFKVYAVIDIGCGLNELGVQRGPSVSSVGTQWKGNGDMRGAVLGKGRCGTVYRRSIENEACYYVVAGS